MVLTAGEAVDEVRAGGGHLGEVADDVLDEADDGVVERVDGEPVREAQGDARDEPGARTRSDQPRCTMAE